MTYVTYRPWPGDLVFVEGKSGLSEGIRMVSTDPKEGASAWASHVAGVIDSDGTLIEANAAGVERTNLYQRYTGYRVEIWRPLLELEVIDSILAEAEKRVGRKYGFLTILQQLFVRMWRGKPEAEAVRRVDLPGEICTEVWAQAWASEGLTFGIAEPWMVTPQDMLRFNRANPDKWRLVLAANSLTKEA